MNAHPEMVAGTRILVTGGAGYIGSHTLLRLLEAGATVHVIDNFSNASPDMLRRVEMLSERRFTFDEADVRDADRLAAVFNAFRPDAVIHFAGLKAVGESVTDPLLYYQNNVTGSLNLLAAMDAVGCGCIIFSSSATVYGQARYLPIDEVHPVNPANPYGRTKAQVENIIQDWVAVDSRRSGISLRYFNPIGAHSSGMIGESPKGIPNNLVPFVARVASGVLPEVSVFGNDFETRDGTGERDYIHVEDLAAGHILALDYALSHPGYDVVNLGTGKGSTVFEVLAAYQQASGREIPWKLSPQRPGDTASSVADPNKATRLLGWRAEKTLFDACRSSWKWQQHTTVDQKAGSV